MANETFSIVEDDSDFTPVNYHSENTHHNGNFRAILSHLYSAVIK